MEQNTEPRLLSNLIWRQVDENTVVVSPQSGDMRVLNGVGSTIWELLAAEKTVDEIVTHVAAHYAVTPEKARDDLQAFLADLRERQLITWEPV